MIRSFLYDTANKEKSAYIWNTSASMLSAFQTVFILMIISRIDPVSDAGIFTIAFAVGNLMLTIGRYGIRPFQVSDVRESYKFSDYLWARIITCLLMIGISIVYVVSNYGFAGENSKKSTVILLVCMTKVIDAFEDVLHGMLQQRQRLDIAGKVVSLRLAGYIVTYLITYIFTKNLVVASSISLLITFIMFLGLNSIAVKEFTKEKISRGAIKNVKKLYIECFPLFISTYLVMYLGNAPKYAIDKVLSNEAQACFNYIFMPVFVIGLVSQFIYQPAIRRLSFAWYNDEKNFFKKAILKQIIIIVILSILAIFGGAFLGIPILSAIYRVDLTGYKQELLVLLIGGGMLAFVNFLQMLITITRHQNWLIGGYILAYIVFLTQGKSVVKNYGIMGISLFYLTVLVALTIIFGIMTCRIITHRYK